MVFSHPWSYLQQSNHVAPLSHKYYYYILTVIVAQHYNHSTVH